MNLPADTQNCVGKINTPGRSTRRSSDIVHSSVMKTSFRNIPANRVAPE